MSVANDSSVLAARRPASPLSIEPSVVVFALLVLVAGAVYLYAGFNGRQSALYILGGALGLVLYHASFGFTSAWRVFIADRRGAGLRAQMVMLAVGSLLFFPALGAGTLFGHPVAGNVSPLSVSVIVGSFLFGVGMQMGGGCASGTLYTVGGGSTRMIVTLAAFIVGSAVGAYHLPWWSSLPALPAVSLVKSWGAWPALAFSLVLFAAIAVVTVVAERRRHGQLIQQNPSPRRGLARFFSGPWPVVSGAVALALLNFATLAIAGKPWGVTSAFALWGSKIAGHIGFAPESWGYWSKPGAAAALHSSIFNDVTSVMDLGIIFGALLAAGLAGRFAPVWRIPARQIVAAIFGGLLLGYGARLAYGCNIGAYFSGIVSSSLHGWLWLVFAFIGNIVGTWIRPFFGLEVERIRPAASHAEA
ncbi:hypothetical protein SAMN05216548_108131 [Faunimonas pinastri]|uniref:Sulphur transport domain-containing protein n=1 Tax=Faunimonas pinastri TaxID=1855383 RepID=A0A1H9JHN4_9HYPH|nr:YeeE/YedE family protein [Faunimonas pinastri]SEQ86372.1 hypothetical protein SAMN05216548_108131 [Faunimonas pinastri]